jgi:PEP-CTERM motif-containing protein
MKISQLCGIALLLLMGSMMAFADGIQDPKIIIKSVAGDLAECPQCKGVGSNFSFTVPEGGSGTLYFTNQSGKNWTSLTLIETGEPAADISCHSNLFSSCTTETLKNGSVEILLSNQGKAQWKDQGIHNGQNFGISFNCLNKSCWPGGLSFSGHGAGAVPEPGTIALMVTGLAGLVSRRKMWKNRFNS